MWAHVTLGLPACVAANQSHRWRFGCLLCAGQTAVHTWCLSYAKTPLSLGLAVVEPKITLGHWLCRTQTSHGSYQRQDPNFL
jgi:hypothetical protein